MYKLYKSREGFVAVVIRLTDNAFIPFDPDNTCYQRYLVWLSEGNIPLPPDEPIQQNEQPSS